MGGSASGSGGRIHGEQNVANSVSSKKRVRQNIDRRLRNRGRKSAIKSETRKFLDLLSQGEVQSAEAAFTDVQKHLDQVAAKGTLHRNTVARRKSRLARQLNLAKAAAK
jgi:small subunit ribosomal protein S20